MSEIKRETERETERDNERIGERGHGDPAGLGGGADSNEGRGN